MNKIQVSKRGFTLIELLIVIAIIAVLAVAVVLVLNPAELLKQGRDATRLSDLGAIDSALGLWLADVTNTSSWGFGGITATRCTSGTVKPGGGAGSCTPNSARTTDGLGWVGPVNLGLISGGSPLAQLPLDPSNGGTTCAGSPAVCFYAFESYATIGQYKLGANMESVKYGTNGGGDVESDAKDGGTVGTWHETGTLVSTAW